MLKQVPPYWHGFDLHSLMSLSHWLPVNPSGQQQKKSPSVVLLNLSTEHVPPFWQGLAVKKNCLYTLYLSALSVKTPLICFAVRKSCKEQTYWCSFPLWLWVWCSPHPPSPGHRFWSPSSRHTSSVLYSPPRGYRIQSTGPRNSRSDTVPPWTVAAWVNVIIEQSKLECQGMQQM